MILPNCETIVARFLRGYYFEERTCTPFICLSESGDWSNQSDWSFCSSSCGIAGHQIRSKMCSNPVHSNKGSYCIGSSFDQRSCILRTACIGTPINGRWTSWSEWS
ncbi:Thrombospondin type 1 domain family protein [Brugia pahangi]